jgi:hypothetical protein
MSRPKIRRALEAAVAALSPALATQWENKAYSPIEGTPYQRVWLIWAEPLNDEFGKACMEQGTLDISLRYPIDAGPVDAEARAELIREAFPRGASFTSGGLTTTITRTAEIATGAIAEGRYIVPVRIRFHTYLTN